LFETLGTHEGEGITETELNKEFDGNDSGSEYSDTNDRRARKEERKAMVLKRTKQMKS
jgi:hypothetical protein